MDREQAKFILESFRPDGADAADADFAQALRLAAEDRELGAWLADERAADAAFASALCEVEIPDDLRQHILAVMRGESPNDPAMDEAMDNILIDAMGSLQPPAGLRDQILAAMEMNNLPQKPSSVVTPSPSQTGWFSGWTRVAAVAAAVVLGAFMAFQLTASKPSDDLLASYQVQQRAGAMLNDIGFQLDARESDPSQVNTWLVNHQLPSLSSIPQRLRSMKSLGCKEIKLPGDRKASLVCFREDSGGTVHLVIVRNQNVSDHNLPRLGNVGEDDCYHCKKTQWNVARWCDEKNTFILLSKSQPSEKNELLRYF